MSEKLCIYDPFGRVSCKHESRDFQTCLLCQPFWIRGLLNRLVIDFEVYAKISATDRVERILKRELTDKERVLVESMVEDGRTISEIVNKLRKNS